MDQIFEKNFITTKDAGELSGYSSDYLARLARSGKINGKRIGHSWFIDQDSLARFLDQQEDRKIDYARALARAREAEYRKHHPLTQRATSVLTKPIVVPSAFVPRSSFRTQALAFSVASIVLVSGAYAAHAAFVPQMASRAAAIARDVASGFSAAFGDIPMRIASKINTTATEVRAVAPRVALRTESSSANFAPRMLLDPDLAPLRMALADDRSATRVSRSPIAFAPPLSAPTTTAVITIADVQTMLRTAYAMIAAPSQSARAFADMHAAIGERAYAGIVASFAAYDTLIARSGAGSLVLAASARDALAAAPSAGWRAAAQMHLALGAIVIESTHAAIGAAVATDYRISVAAPKGARAALAFVSGTGDTLARAAARAPALAAALYLHATAVPARIAPALAQAIFDEEYAGASRVVALGNVVTERYTLALRGLGDAGYAGATGMHAIAARLALAPDVVEDAYLGTLGRSAAALDALIRMPKVADALAAAAPALSAGEQVALATYRTVRGLFDSATRTLATLIGPPPPIVVPSPPSAAPKNRPVATAPAPQIESRKPQTVLQTTNSYPTYTTTTVVKGVSEDFVKQSLASLRTDILGTVSGMIQPVSRQVVTNSTTIQQVNMIQKLDDLTVTRGTFTGGIFDSGIRVAATDGNFTNLFGGTTSLATTTIAGDLAVSGALSSNTSASAPYFMATSTTATSTFAGSLNVDSGGFVYATSTRNIGIGVLSPAALLALQNSTSTQPIFIASNAAGTEVYRITNAGFVGIGTTSPGYNLAVEGSSSLGNQAIAGYFTATSTNATSTFAGRLAIGTSTPYGDGLLTIGTSSPLLHISSNTGTVGVNTLASAYTLDINGSLRSASDAFFNASTYLGNATTSDVAYFNARIGTHLVPTVDNVSDLGSGSDWLRWRTGYFGTSVGIGGTATSTGTNLLANGTYLIDSGATLSLNTTNNQPVVFGSGNVNLPYASSTALTIANALWVGGNATTTSNGDFTTNGNLTASGTTGVTLTGAGAGLTFSGTGNHDITASGGTLRLGANTIIGNILALDSTIDIGTAGTPFDKVYADEINATTLVGTIVGGNVSSETLRINSDNTSDDEENAYLAFERGSPTPNALLTWNAANSGKRFEFNYPLYIQSASTTVATSTLFVQGSAGQTGDVFRVASSSDSTATYFNVTNLGNVGIGTTSPSWKFDVWGQSDQPVVARFTNTYNDTGVAIHNSATGGKQWVLYSSDGSGAGISNGGFTIRNSTGAGLNAFTILPTGEIGIGTTTPPALLTVNDPAGVNPFYIGSSTPKFIVTHGGNVGIGAASPKGKLFVSAPDSAIYSDWSTGGATAGGTIGLFANANNGGIVSNWYYNAGDGTNRYARAGGSSQIYLDVTANSTAGDIVFRSAASGAADASFNFTEGMRLTQAGNLGIGTTTPASKLQIHDGNFALSDTDVAHGVTTVVSTNAFGRFAPNSGTGGGLEILGLSDTDASSQALVLGGIIGTDSATVPAVEIIGYKKSGTGLAPVSAANKLFSITNFVSGGQGGEWMTVLGDGRIGMGTTSPYSLLSISNSVSTAANTPLFTIASTTAGTATSTLLTVLANGNVGVGTAAPIDKLNIVSGALRLTGSAAHGGAAASTAIVSESEGSLVLSSFGTDTNTRGVLQVYLAKSNNGSGIYPFVIANDGNVGIGTTTPNSLLSLYQASADTGLSFGNSNATMWTMGTDISDGSKFKISSSSALGTNDRLTIDTNGNVGIGTTGPGKLLHVYSASDNAALEIQAAASGKNVSLLLSPGYQGTVDISNVGGLNPAAGMLFKQTSLAASTPPSGPGSSFDAFQFQENQSWGFSAAGNYNNIAIRDTYTGASGINYASITLKPTINQSGTGGNVTVLDINPTNTSFLGSSFYLINAQVGNSSKFLVDYSGNVGIGTTSPSNLLSVYSATAATQGFSGGATKGIWSMGYDVTNNRFAIASSSDITSNVRMVIDNSGNVGIGTTTPNSLLSLYQASADTGLSFGNSNATMWTMGTDISDGSKFKISSSSALGTNDRLTIDTNGNVGIGTTEPLSKLDVRYTFRVSTTNSLYYAYIEANNVQTNAFKLGFNGHNLITTGDDYYYGRTLQLWTNDNPRVTVNLNGNVGIGTTTPNALLNIASTLPYFYLTDTNAATDNKHWFMENNAGVLSFGTTTDALAVSGTRALSILNNGNVGIGTTTPSNLLSVYSATAATQGFSGGATKGIWSMGYDVTNNRFAIASSSSITSNVRMVIDNSGNVGIGTTSPFANLSIAGTAGGSTNLFAISTSTSLFATTTALTINSSGDLALLNGANLSVGGLSTLQNGFVSQASSTVVGAFTATGNITFGGTLTVNGLCVAADTRLRRRRKARKGEEDEADAGGYIYDDVMIKDIRAGDEIASLHPITGRIVWSRVNALMFMGNKDIWALRTASNRLIRTTANHPYFVRMSKKRPDQKLYRFEVDISNKVEHLSKDTIVAVSSGEHSATALITAEAKRELLSEWREAGAAKRFAPSVYAALIGEALARLPVVVHELLIDVDYVGYDTLITNIVKHTTPDADIHFVRVGKNSPAHHAAYRVHAGTKQADVCVTRETLGGKTESALRAPSRSNLSAERFGGPQALSLTSKIFDSEQFVKEGVWIPVKELREGHEIAVVYGEGVHARVAWEPITSIVVQRPEPVYDIEVEGTHNFIGNGIVAHNTAIFNQASTTMLTNSGSTWLTDLSASSLIATDDNKMLISTTSIGVNNLALAKGNFLVGNDAGVAQATSTIFISSTGNVGIGTTGPGYKLEVTETTSPILAITPGDNATADPTLYLRDTTTANGFKLWYDNDIGDTYFDSKYSAGDMVFRTGVDGTAVEAIRINSNGNVGLGSGAGSNPVSKLAINGGVSIGDTTFAQTAAPTEGMIIKGNVGIGTTSPTELLSVNGNLRFEGHALIAAALPNRHTVSSGFKGFWPGANSSLMASTANGYEGWVLNSNVVRGSGDWVLQDTTKPGWSVGSLYGSSADNFFIQRTPASAGNVGSTLATLFMINNLGNVGIGTTTPTAKLMVRGAGTTTGKAFSVIDSSNVEKLTVLDSGNVGIGTVDPVVKLHISFDGVAPSSALYNSLDTFVASRSGGGGVFRMLASEDVVGNGGAFISVKSRGTLSSPTIVQSGDSLGLFTAMGYDGTARQSAGAIRFEVDGTPGANDMPGRITFQTTPDGSSTLADRMVINSGGNVGIGTTTPSNLLSVYSATAATQGFSGGATKGIWSMGYDVTNNRFAIASSSDITSNVRMVIDNTGNVGIGTTNPGSILDVFGTTAVKPRITWTTNTSWGGLDLYEGATQIGYIQGVGSNFATADRRGDVEILSVSNDISFWPGAAQTVTFKNGGNVGIGTTTPETTLDVNGGFRVMGNIIPSAGAGIEMVYDSDATAVSASGGSGAGLFTFYDRSGAAYKDFGVYANNIYLKPSGATGLYIASTSGNVGIGTTSPSNLLSVYSATAATQGFSGGATKGIWSMGYDVTNNRFAIASSSDITSNVRMVIDNTGNVGIGTTGPEKKLNVFVSSAGTVDPYSSADLLIESGSSTGINVLNPDASTGAISFGSASDNYGAYVNWNYNNNLMALGSSKTGASVGFYSGNNVAAMRIDSSGNVGIGTTTPNSILSLYQASSDTGLSFGNSNATMWTMGTDISDGSKFKISSSSALGTNDRLTIDTNGNVGIGTTGPQFALHIGAGGQTSLQGTGYPGIYVNPNSQGSQITIENNLGVEVGMTTSATNAYIGSWSNNKVILRTNNADRVTLDTGGNVGIGTTTPGVKLDISGADSTSVRIISNTSANGGTRDSQILFGNYLTDRASIGWDVSGNALNFSVEGVGTITPGDVSIGVAMSLTSTGNVGIGTTTPSNLLSVYSATAATQGFSGGATKGIWSMGYDVTNNRFAIASSSDITSNVRMVIDGNGNVGIGTTAPTTLLHVDTASGNTIGTFSSTGATDAFLRFVRTGSNGWAIGRDNDGATFKIAYAGNDTPAVGTGDLLTMKSTGNVGIGTTTPTSLLNIAGATAPKFTLSDTDATANQKHWFIESDSGSFNIGTTSDALATNAVFRALTINSSGNVGIGTTTPNSLLSLYQASADTGLSFGNSNATMWIMGTDISDGSKFKISSSSALGTNDRLTIDTNGNVGIGTTAPGSKLHVVDAAGSVVFNVDFLRGGSSSAGRFLIQALSDATYRALRFEGSSMTFAPSGGGTLTIGNTGITTLSQNLVVSGTGDTTIAGNVGIGTTSPSGMLDVSGGNISMVLGADNTLTTRTVNTSKVFRMGSASYGGGLVPTAMIYGLNNSGTSALYIGGGTSLMNAATDLHFFTTGSGITTVTGTERMTIDSGGNVGIGTSTPNQLLHIAGADPVFKLENRTAGGATNMFIQNITDASGNRLRFYNGSNYMMGIWQSGGVSVGGNYAGTISPANGLIVEGNIGIGTTTPGAKLEVHDGSITISNDLGDGGIPSLSLSNWDSGGNNWSIQSHETGTAGGAGNLLFRNVTQNGNYMVINSTGNVGIGTTTPASLLQIYGDGNSNAGLLTLTQNDVPTGTSADGAHIIFGDTGTAARAFVGLFDTANHGAGTQLNLKSAGNIGLTAGSVSNANQVTIDTNGNVGIGTTSPGSRLNVTSAAPSGALSVLRINEAGGTRGDWNFGLNQNANLYVYPTTDVSGAKFVVSSDSTQATTRFAVNTNSGETWLAPSGGNVGIGITSPTNLLHIATSTSGSNAGINIDMASETAGTAGIIRFNKSRGTIASQADVQNGDALGYFNFKGWKSDAYYSATAIGAVVDGALGTYVPGKLQFYTSNSSTIDNVRMVIDSNGNVGIGTTSPPALLSIGSAAPVSAINSENFGLYNNGPSKVLVARGSDNASPGAVEFAKSRGTLGSPTTVLADDALGVLGFDGYNGAWRAGVAGIYAYAAAGVGTGTDLPTYLTFNTTPDGSATMQERLRITSDGNVGIGTTTPSSLLNIYAATGPATLTVEAGESSDYVGGTLLLKSVGTASARGNGVFMYDYNGQTEWYAGTPYQNAGTAYMIGRTSSISAHTKNLAQLSNALMVINSSGNVGIGTTTPGTLLDVVADNPIIRSRSKHATEWAEIVISNTGGDFIIGREKSTGNALLTGDTGYAAVLTANGTYPMQFGINDSVKMTILNAGNVGIGTTSPWSLFSVAGTITQTAQKSCANGLTTDSNGAINGCAASDVSLKTNIADSTYEALSIINQLRPVSYQWRNPSVKDALIHSGFIAQDVEAVFPSAVVGGGYDEFGNPMKAIDPNAINSLLVRGLQELNARFLIPEGSQTSSTTTSAVLTADGKGIDIYKLATYAVSAADDLAAKIDAHEVRMTSLEARVDALESGAVSTTSGSPISLSSSTSALASALEGFGVLIQKGIAQFNTLVFRQLVASKDADGTSSAGSVNILKGNTVAQVTNALVLPSTKVFVTFNSQIEGSWWVSDKAAGSFRVVLSTAQAADVSFDYFLVQTEGQIATSTPEVGGSQTSNASSGSLTSSTDRTPPTITLLGDNPLYLSVGGAYVEPGVQIADDSGGTNPVKTYVNGVEQDPTAIDTSSTTTYIITYSVTDAAGNLATARRSVIVGGEQAAAGDSADGGSEASALSGSLASASAPADSTDTVPPVVTLVGDAAMQIDVGDTFTDPGATASDPSMDSTGSPQADSAGTDLTSSIVVTGAVDTATAGLYTLTYAATDAAGNSGSVSRVVTVVAPSAPAPAPEPAPAPDSAPAPEPVPAPVDTTPAPAE